MRYLIAFVFLFVAASYSAAQSPELLRDAGSKYIYMKSTNNDNDFKNVAQLRIGSYLTLGNYGYSNISWIGSNVLLDYSSYGNVGTEGNKNKFMPLYEHGKALVLDITFDGSLKGLFYNWNGDPTSVDKENFTKSWEISPTQSFFMSNVLIGKASQVNSSYKLDVEGKIRANEIVVNTTGADFVFEPEYDLPSLDFVEQYIIENKHLPEIPSAAEMQESGMPVGELNTKLLQKVEELTLYLIQQKNEIEELREEIDNLKEK